MVTVNQENLANALIEGAEKFLNRRTIIVGVLSLGLNNPVTFFAYTSNRIVAKNVIDFLNKLEGWGLHRLLLADIVISSHEYGLLGKYVCESIAKGSVFDQQEFDLQKKAVEKEQPAEPMYRNYEIEAEETVRRLLKNAVSEKSNFSQESVKSTRERLNLSLNQTGQQLTLSREMESMPKIPKIKQA